MNHRYSIKIIFLLTVIVMLGFSGRAFADPGMGYGRHYGWGHPMHEMHHGGYGGPGFDYWAEISEEDIQKLYNERSAFFDATKDLRSSLYQKGLELRSELAKESPDAAKASALQKEISELRGEFAQKRLNHFLNVRKIIPEIGRGFGRGYGIMGPGMMHRGMIGTWATGPGRYGGGNFPACPYGGPSGGYGKGPGMMGPRW